MRCANSIATTLRQTPASRYLSLPACLVIALLLAPCAVATPLAASGKELAFGTGVTNDTVLYRYLSRMLAQTLQESGYRATIKSYPFIRSEHLLTSGALDGELARSDAFGKQHPQLVRVDEPIYQMRMTAYGLKGQAWIMTPQGLAGKRVSLKRGAVQSEQLLDDITPKPTRQYYDSYQQGIMQLVAGRVEYMLVSDEMLIHDILQQRDTAIHVRKAGVLRTVPLYIFLHPKYADLAPKLAQQLARMKAAGTDKALQAELMHGSTMQ